MLALTALEHACNARGSKLEVLYPFFEDAFAKYDVSTPARQAYWLAQFAFETDRWRVLEEYATGARYEGRHDLGNTEPGDGVRFKGRAVPMLTGRANYAAFSRAVLGNDTLLEHPERLTEPELAVEAGGWFWKTKGLNALADRGDFEGATRRINGAIVATTHYPERLALLAALT